MEEETILREDVVLSKAALPSTEDSAAYPDDTTLNSEDEFPRAQIERSTTKRANERQEEQPPKPPRSPIKRCRDTLRGGYEDRPKKRSPLF